jgi:serine/threonine-protein kinase
MSSVQSGALVGQMLGKYELLALLAIGGTAEIYLARIGGEAGFEKYVVVKSLLDHLADEPEYVKMFLDEARLGAQLDHSNIVQTLELGEQNGRYYMVMEYLAGMSLAQLARRTQERVSGGYMPVDLVLGLAAQTCAGLTYAHRKAHAGGKQLNLVHRDISPQNLVVSFDGVLKIVDFGIAKADMRDTHTRSGTIKGKFAYMSPEQCLAKHVDHRTDIFALGVILHELLCARRLFKRATTYETYEAIIKGKVPRPSEVNQALDPALDDVVLKALQYNREDRYESAEAFGQTLLQTLHRRGVSISASDVANYYETHFEPELEQHHERMRELITGQRRRASDEALNWDAAEPVEVVNPSDVMELSDGDVEDLDPETDRPDQGDLDPDTVEPALDNAATRIEMNPLERAQEAHAPPPATAIDQLAEHDTQDLAGEIESLISDTADGAEPVVRESPPPDPASARTIGPGQLTADKLPSIFDRAAKDKGPPPPAASKPQPKKTVMGMAPPSVAAAAAAARAKQGEESPPKAGGKSAAKTLFAAGGAPGAVPARPLEAEAKPGGTAAAKTLFTPGASGAAGSGAPPPRPEPPRAGASAKTLFTPGGGDAPPQQPERPRAGANAKTMFTPGGDASGQAGDSEAPEPQPGPPRAGANAKTMFTPGSNNAAAEPASKTPDSPGPPQAAGAGAKTMFAPNAAGNGPPRSFGPPPPGANPVPPDTLPPVGDRSSGSVPQMRPPQPQHRPHPSYGQQNVSTQIRPAQPRWLIAVVFAVSLGIGLGLTLLIGS